MSGGAWRKANQILRPTRACCGGRKGNGSDHLVLGSDISKLPEFFSSATRGASLLLLRKSDVATTSFRPLIHHYQRVTLCALRDVVKRKETRKVKALVESNHNVPITALFRFCDKDVVKSKCSDAGKAK
jgi:hypothetical protein